MAKRKKQITEPQKEVMRYHGLSPNLWEVRQDLLSCMIVRHRITGDFRMIEKNKIPS